MPKEAHPHRKSKTCTGKKTGKPLAEYGTEGKAREAALYASAEYKRHLTPYFCQTCNKRHLSPARHPAQPAHLLRRQRLVRLCRLAPAESAACRNVKTEKDMTMADKRLTHAKGDHAGRHNHYTYTGEV